MTLMKVAALLRRPYGKTVHCHWPDGVTIDVFSLLSGCIGICQYAAEMSHTLYIDACLSPNMSHTSSRRGSGNACGFVTEFSLRKSPQRRQDPSFFLTNTTGDVHLAVEGFNRPCLTKV